MTKYAIKVLPKKEVLDSQGRAVEDVLKKAGFSIEDCHIGKYFEVKTDKGETEVKKMAEYVLYNPLIEEITIESLKEL